MTSSPAARVVALASLLLAAGCAGQAAGPARSWYAAHDGVAPRADRIYVCHAFGCARKTAVDYSAKDLATLRRILAKGRTSQAAERKAIAEAVAWSERKTGPVVGSENDVGGYDLQNSGVPGQMDCIDEATNTTSLLLLAEGRGYLSHHTVSRPVARGFFLDGRYPHATAVVRSSDGAAFAIDSWPQSNGKLPVVQDLDAWFAERS